MTPMLTLFCSALLAALLPALASAQSPPPSPPLTLTVAAYGFATQWHPSQASLPLTYVLDLPYSSSLDKVEMAHTAYLELAQGRWGGYVDKQYIKAKDSDQFEHIPFQLKAKMDKTSIGLYVNALVPPESEGRHLTLQPTLGIHFNRVAVDIKAEVMAQALYYNGHTNWSEPYVGARFFYHHSPRWALAGQLNVGSRRSKDYQAYALYRSKLFNKPISLRLGYRLLDQDHRRGDFVWDIRESGPVVGFSMHIL